MVSAVAVFKMIEFDDAALFYMFHQTTGLSKILRHALWQIEPECMEFAGIGSEVAIDT
jgi:hypothetical protein